MERSSDWLSQATRDVRLAELSLKEHYYEWACFAAQQAAEKAVKALIQKLGGEAWGHSVASLLESLPENLRDSSLYDKALELDQAYIPSRYPNSHPKNYPGVLYTRSMAERLIKYSKEIIEYCQGLILQVKRDE
ncbi:HEPN domain-containing protein [Candidatus Bathyarchaeota archaeon]|nr:HEPN domain-containing protein [Candidatus Bathyarchaeota archaeon]